jgi:hypothetical protein
MQKLTLKFLTLADMAKCAKLFTSGYLMNTNNFTLTGRFIRSEIELALDNFNASILETNEKVYSY